MAVHGLFVLGSFCLVFALISCSVSFFCPFWLGNVTAPRPGRDTQPVELDLTYLVAGRGRGSGLPSTYSWRGLWAQCQCFSECQWFWQHDYRLQANKFTPLRWHLATQILYFIGSALVLLCEIYARAQLCCMQRKSVYRTLGVILLASFVIQVAAIATFGGFAGSDYGAETSTSGRYTYLGWCFWVALVGSIFTALAGLCFVSIDCFGRRLCAASPRKADETS